MSLSFSSFPPYLPMAFISLLSLFLLMSLNFFYIMQAQYQRQIQIPSLSSPANSASTISSEDLPF